MKYRLFRCIASEDDQPLTIHSYIRMRKSRIYKNLLFLSLSQCVIYVMYKTMMMLREYEHDFIGIWSYTIFNFAKIFGFLLVPKFFLSRFGLRKTVQCGMFVCSLLIFILYVKLIEIVIPVALLMGFFASTTWVSQQFYVYRLARIMTKVSGDDLETILLRFSGIFFSIYRSYDIACYLPITFVPSSDKTSNASKEHCGPGFNFGDYDSLSEFTLPPRNESSYVASVTVIFLAFCCLLLSIVLIDPPNKLTSTYLGFEDYKPGLSTTIRLFKRRRLQLMIPMTVFAGFEKTMKSYDFTTAYVGCTESAQRSIYVYFLGCLASSQMSLALAPLVEITSLQIILAIATITHLILILILLLHNHTSLISYYVVSAMWGLASSTWDCLLYVLYSMLSPGDELEAYCHLGFWYSIGAFGNLSLTKLVPVSFKLWTSFVCLLLATISVLMLPHIIRYLPQKVGPTVDEAPVKSSNSESSRQPGVDDTTRKANVYFDKTTTYREYNPSEVKSITSSRIHHVAIPKTRYRFDRHEASNEDVDV